MPSTASQPNPVHTCGSVKAMDINSLWNLGTGGHTMHASKLARTTARGDWHADKAPSSCQGPDRSLFGQFGSLPFLALFFFRSAWLHLRPYFFVHLLSVCSFSTRVVFTPRLYRIKIRGLMRSRSRM